MSFILDFKTAHPTYFDYWTQSEKRDLVTKLICEAFNVKRHSATLIKINGGFFKINPSGFYWCKKNNYSLQIPWFFLRKIEIRPDLPGFICNDMIFTKMETE